MDRLTDSELVRIARTGDKQAMDQLLQRHEAVALSVVTRFVGEQLLARDLVQDAMLGAWLSLDKLRDVNKFRAWFCGIALNKARSHLRRQRTAHMSLESMLGGVSGAAIALTTVADYTVADPTVADPAVTVELSELERTVSEAIDRLPDGSRSAMRLYYFEHLSVHEVAAALGISESAAKSRLFKARRRLRASLAAAWHEFFVPHQPSVHPRSVAEEDPMSTTNNLIPVTVADVVGRSEDEQMPEHLVVVLHDEARDRILPIWVGSYEAQAIAMGLREFSTPRPMTYNFLANLLTLSGVEIVDIRIDALRETTYYGVVRVRRVDTTSGAISELDARPSDALALALRVGCPIYAAPEVMEKAASSVPEEYLDREWQGRGAALVLDEMETLMQRHMAKKEEPDDAVELKERDARDSLLKQLFGDG